MTVDIGGTSYVCSIEENLKNKSKFYCTIKRSLTTVASSLDYECLR